MTEISGIDDDGNGGKASDDFSFLTVGCLRSKIGTVDNDLFCPKVYC